MKKASLSLSVNAIVILILAITMLGLGIAFIKNMFGQATGNLEELIGSEPAPNTPTSSDAVTLSKEHIITTTGKTEILKIAVFNPTNTDWNDVSITSYCTPKPPFTNFSISKKIEQNSFKEFILQLRGISGDKGSYLCDAIADSTDMSKPYRKGFTIEITD